MYVVIFHRYKYCALFWTGI